MGLFKDYVSQTRKPEGFLGKMMVNGMNSGHARMADWGMAHLKTITPVKIVDIGCGGGRNAGELLEKYPSARVTAIDYSDVSVKKGLREIRRPFLHHPSMSICFFSGSFSLSFLGRVRFKTPCLKLALISSSVMFSPT